MGCGPVLYCVDTLLLRMDYAVAQTNSQDARLGEHDKRLRALEMEQFKRSGR